MSDRFNFSSTKYGPSVCWGLTVQAGIGEAADAIETGCLRQHPNSVTAKVPLTKPSNSRRVRFETTEIIFGTGFFMVFCRDRPPTILAIKFSIDLFCHFHINMFQTHRIAGDRIQRNPVKTINNLFQFQTFRQPKS